MRIEPIPTPEGAAAIVAALELLREGPKEQAPLVSRWELAGRLGRGLPPNAPLPESVWGYGWWYV
jgi:hypothetical protein